LTVLSLFAKIEGKRLFMKRMMMANLLRWKGETPRKPLLLKGVRQVGKTYLLKEFGRLHFPQFHYLNFEKDPKLAKIFEPDLVPKRILQELSFYLDQGIDIANDLLIFDEIQECPKALTSLKYFSEEYSELYLCGAGSLLGIHLNAGSFPVGKVTFQTLRPISFEEFLLASADVKSLEFIQNFKTTDKTPEIIHEHIWNQLKYYFIVGGLPEVVSAYCKYKENLFEAFIQVRKKQDDLINTYYADISKHSGKINAMHIDRIFRAVPMQLSQEQEHSITRFKFKGIIPGITHYDRLASAIDWLEAAGLIIKIQIVNTGHLPFMAYTKENFFKLLIFDVGILGSMSGLSPKTILDYDYGTYKGYFAENFVAEELISIGIDRLFSWQENRGEVEFLTEIAGEAIPIEVKSGFITKTKSLQAFSEKYKPPFQVVLSGKPFHIDKTHGKYYYPLYLVSRLPLKVISG
jgi:predicted AAA+ superfamily ATPase